jgi:uncharacterized protein (DUF488 family)
LSGSRFLGSCPLVCLLTGIDVTVLAVVTGMAVYTIGHSTREQPELFTLLRRNGVTLLCDIRTYPSSRHCPQWNQQAIIDGLPADIGYRHLPALGGRRAALPVNESINGAWRNISFRGYADYMQSPAFGTGLAELLQLAARHTVAIMCAEAVPWRCHRSLVTDALIAHSVPVCHIMSSNTTTPATIHAFAQVLDEHVSYPTAPSGAEPG